MHSRRVVSGLLSLAITVGSCTAWLPAAAAAGRQESSALLTEQTATGTIALTLTFDLPQRVEEVESRDIRLHLTGSSQDITVHLKDGSAAGAEGLSVSVEALNEQGIPLTTEQRLGAYEAVVSGLPLGDYTMTVSGTGYAARSAEVSLQDYSRHVLMSTADGTFSLGDVNGDGVVSSADRAALDGQLGLTGALDTYDLNGDDLVDIVDLSYVNAVMDLTAAPPVLSTAAIVKPHVDESAVTVTGGSQEDLFTGDKSVTVAPAEGQSELAIPVDFGNAPVTMSEIAITSPSAQGAIQAGTAVVETEDGETFTVPFDISAPAGVHPIGRTAGQSVVTIDLGKKVAVKKVTITVTKVEGQTGNTPQFATVTQIEFLKDIVPEEGKADTQVKNLTAAAGDGSVSLSWDSVQNVTGYVVKYSTTQKGLEQASCPSVSAGVNKAVISDLENGAAYYFQVTAVNGDWSGLPSVIVSATPLASNPPDAPTNLAAEPADGALRLSWSKAKDADYYQVFYRQQGVSSWTQWGGNLSATSAVITGLTNGAVYEAAVKAGNHKGVGPLSAIASATPGKEGFELPELPADGRIDNGEITSIAMADKGNVNWDLAPGFTVDHLIDNDPNTYWIAKNYWYDSSITYTFETTHDMNYLLVVPYLDPAYKNRIANYTVTLKGEDGQVLATYNRAGANVTAGDYYIFSFPETKDVKSVTLALGEKTGGPRVSISEIAFYESENLVSGITELFADDAFTQLKSGVEQADITALQDRLSALSSFYLDVERLRDELTLAQGLLDRDETVLGLVKNDFQSRSAAAAADTAAGQTASDLQPLGITAKAGATVAIYAQLPGDQPVYVVPTQFYGESGVWKGDAIALKNGRNYITVPQIGSLTDTRGGMLYLTYAGASAGDIKLQVRVLANAWEMPVLELSDWYDLNETQRKETIRTYIQALNACVSGLSGTLTTNIRNATEISTPSVLLSLPADQVLSGLSGVGNDEDAMVETMYQNVLAWEEALFAANQVQGIIPSDASLTSYQYPMTTRQNIRYMRMFPGAFMYAAGSHIGVEYGSTAALAQGRPTAATGAGKPNGLFGWGIAHEIGHNMDKLGRAEITNNIYSLALQAWDGASMTQNTRLTADGRWAQIFDKVAQARPGAANNVFVQLGMYWQLHLAYDEADQPLAFYNTFFKAWKSGAYSGYSYDERVALVASQAAGRDLTEFFTRWGMTLSDSVKDILSGYPAEGRAIWYLNDDARTYRLQSGSAADGAASVTASVNESKVTLTISHTDGGKILGYEIRRNGKAIGFTTETTYVDDLGAANNLAYTYSVVPVDKLGSVGSEAQANEVRVAYDKTIDSGLYDLTRTEEGAITITMKSGAAVPVTGIKVTGAGLSGSYTVKVKANPAAQAWTTAKTGTLSDNLAAYFTKPGAEESDTRIWTYDAAVLEITGIPADAQVALLDYPGDRVDFYEGVAAGILKEDYKYGDGADEVIPAGTLVILGTYRGDPTYNYVEIEARYNTTPEAGEVTTIQRAMNGYGLLLAEIPADGAVSDTSDGFFLFVPDLEAEAALNAQDGVTDAYPLEIRANFYRTDSATSAGSKRLTSQTLWLSFPEGGDDEEQVSLPVIELKSALRQMKG